MLQASPERLARDLDVLAKDIGVRLAGTAGERAAADYIIARAREIGAETWEEPFPVQSRIVSEEQLDVLVGGTWHRFPCSLFSNTPGTDGAWRSAEIAVVAPTDYQRDDFDQLRGKAVIDLGCHIESRRSYQRLMAAGPAFLLMVDTRYPGTTPLADGMFPAYTAGIGAVPTLSVAYQDAWDWVRQGATEARCRILGGMSPGTSQNIVIDLPGTDLRDEVLYVGAHHDTQAASPGADDNASGVIGVLELARLLHGCLRRRTIRIISFGAEEQLSVGSAAYVRTHRRDVSAQGRLMYNLDSVRVTARVAAAARQRTPRLRSILPSVLPGCRPVLPDHHERGPVRRSLSVRGSGRCRGVSPPRQLQRRAILPPSSRRRREPGVAGGDGARRVGGRDLARPDGDC